MMEQNIINCSCNENLLELIANFLTVIIALANLIFIAAVHFKDKKDNDTKEKQKNKIEKEKEEQEYKFNWYKMIHVSKRIDELSTISDQIIKSYELIYSSNEKDIDKLKKINRDENYKLDLLLKKEKSKFTYILKSLDEKENKKLSNLYNLLQEKYYTYLGNAVLKEKGDFSEINIVVNKIANAYYELGHNILNGK